MKAIVAGAGSIGRRHVASLLCRSDVERVTVVTSWPGAAAAMPADARLAIVAPGDPVDADIAIVAVETDRHIATATQLVEAGVDTLIEKPLSHSRTGIDALAAVARESGALVCVGYNLRFLPALAALREAVVGGTLGRVLYARFEAGQYLPDWRPDRDYREIYSASRARGGGVALDLSHEVDAMRFVLGDPVDWQVVSRHVSDLAIESDDIFEGRYDYDGGAIAAVHLDYLAPRLVRAYRVLGEDGDMLVDVANARTVVTTRSEVRVIEDPEQFAVGATYPAQLDAFLAARDGAETPIATLADGIRVLDLLEDSHAR